MVSRSVATGQKCPNSNMKTIHSFFKCPKLVLWNVKKVIALKGFQDTKAPEEDIYTLNEIMGCKIVRRD